MEHAKKPSATKKGPGRYHAAVKSGKAKKTNFAAALMASWAAKRDYIDPQGEPSLPVHRLPGHKCRRVWLAGISAQRGF